tara:strand:- start:573 stop:902 length:330 start_codon:yes stop_codon:yes gene_type:complete
MPIEMVQPLGTTSQPVAMKIMPGPPPEEVAQAPAPPPVNPAASNMQSVAATMLQNEEPVKDNAGAGGAIGTLLGAGAGALLAGPNGAAAGASLGAGIGNSIGDALQELF